MGPFQFLPYFTAFSVLYLSKISQGYICERALKKTKRNTNMLIHLQCNWLHYLLEDGDWRLRDEQ